MMLKSRELDAQEVSAQRLELQELKPMIFLPTLEVHRFNSQAIYKE